MYNLLDPLVTSRWGTLRSMYNNLLTKKCALCVIPVAILP